MSAAVLLELLASPLLDDVSPLLDDVSLDPPELPVDSEPPSLELELPSLELELELSVVLTLVLLVVGAVPDEPSVAGAVVDVVSSPVLPSPPPSSPHAPASAAKPNQITRIVVGKAIAGVIVRPRADPSPRLNAPYTSGIVMGCGIPNVRGRPQSQCCCSDARRPRPHS